MDDGKISLLARLARTRDIQTSERPVSILSLAAASFGAQPEDDATVPTGFDPQAVALFEAIVEGAYLVSTADGVFDDEERKTFERVVITACGGVVAPTQISALVADLKDQLDEDGLEKRIAMLAKQGFRKEHAREVLRIAALLAQASGDVSEVERGVLLELATAFGLGAQEVDRALLEVRAALTSGDTP